MTSPKTAMVLAAGLGSRMRPLTDDRPKALVEVRGRALIDHVLDRLTDAGVERAVVNVHWFADRLEQHLKARDRGPDIIISDERAELLETGGGLRKARPLLGDEPVFVANIDSIWTDQGDALGAGGQACSAIEGFGGVAGCGDQDGRGPWTAGPARVGGRDLVDDARPVSAQPSGHAARGVLRGAHAGQERIR